MLVANEISPLDFNNTSPVAPAAVVLRLPFTLIVPPYAVMGPAIVVLCKLTVLLLVVLPKVKPPRVLPNVHPDVEKLPVKPVPTDSIRKAPAPANEALDVVGALFDSTKVPALIVVAPV